MSKDKESAKCDDQRPVIRWFLSYSKKNIKAKKAFVDLFEERLACSKYFSFERWEDGDIRLGDDWHQAIMQAIEHCDFGLLLLSHAFFSNDYIRRYELPYFTRRWNSGVGKKLTVPVALERVRIDSIDMGGLERKQIYFDQDGRSFKERVGPRRDAWVNGLVDRLEEMLFDSDRTEGALVRPASLEGGPYEKGVFPSAEMMGLVDLHQAEKCLLETTYGQIQPLSVDRLAVGRRLGVNVLDHVLDWAGDTTGANVLALLGEYGTGKTITCQRFVRALTAKREIDQTIAPVLYFDLRNLTGLDRKVPTLQELTNECILRGWQASSTKWEVGPNTFSHWINAGAIVVFDGLDEALIHLSEGEGSVFTRELLKLTNQSGERPDDPKPRILISCRTHYFRTLREQKQYFLRSKDTAASGEGYLALVLLPFSEDQVLEYLARALPGSEPCRIQDLIQSIHNLADLAKRPYNLRLIAEFIPEIEGWRAEGRTVYAVALYRLMIQAWLDRPLTKHIIKPDHKWLVMSSLAAEMLRSGRSLFPIEELDNWFTRFLASRSDLKSRYSSLHPDKLEEDLRSATFLVRQDSRSTDRHSVFKFAHKSIEEYFVAEYLFRAISEDNVKAWAIPLPSLEALDFLGQMLAESADDSLLARLRSWATRRRKGVGELLLAYVSRALEMKWPIPTICGIDLSGADLNGCKFCGDKDQSLDLSGANLTGTQLRRTRWRHVSLRGAKFTEAALNRSEFVHVDAEKADFKGADLTGTLWRHCILRYTEYAGASTYRMQWMYCVGVSGPALSGALILPGTSPQSPAVPASMKVQTSLRQLSEYENTAMTCCAFTFDGALIASAGGDPFIWICDSASGEILHSLRHHQNHVRCLAFAPSGTEFVSGGAEGSLVLWDTMRGGVLKRFKSSSANMTCCSFSPNGDRVVAGYKDGNIEILYVKTDQKLIFSAHDGSVIDCAFSASSDTLVSVGFDGVVRIWDSEKGVELSTVIQREAGIRSGGFSRNGSRLVCADGLNVMVFDVTTSELVRILYGTGSSEITCCVLSADGSKVAVAEVDEGVRIFDLARDAPLCMVTVRVGLDSECVFSPEGRRILVAAAEDNIPIIDATRGDILFYIPGCIEQVNSRICNGVGDSLEKAPEVLLTLGDDNAIYAWDVISGKAMLRFVDDEEEIASCALSPDKKKLAIGGRFGKIQVICIAGNEVIWMSVIEMSRISFCRFTDDSERLITSSEKYVHLWDAENGVLISKFHGAIDPWVYREDRLPFFFQNRHGATIATNAEDGSNWVFRMKEKSHISVISCSRDGYVVWDPESLAIYDAAGDFWRWFGFSGIDPVTRKLRRYPPEEFGSLPFPGASK